MDLMADKLCRVLTAMSFLGRIERTTRKYSFLIQIREIENLLGQQMNCVPGARICVLYCRIFCSL